MISESTTNGEERVVLEIATKKTLAKKMGKSAEAIEESNKGVVSEPGTNGEEGVVPEIATDEKTKKVGWLKKIMGKTEESNEEVVSEPATDGAGVVPEIATDEEAKKSKGALKEKLTRTVTRTETRY